MLIVLATLLVLALPTPAYAYLDPGTGSMLLSVFIGLLSAAYFVARKIPTLIRATIFKATGRTRLISRKHLVIYGESSNYWGTFRPLLEEFGRRGIAVEYLTSSNNDPCFTTNLPECITCQYIGTGNAAYTTLNFCEADAMVLTTPGVDVLQIRRSKGVEKYIHVLHSTSDIHYYKLFSFDYYDAVICNGAYQVRSLRTLEQARGTTPKELPIAGCPYLDGLAERRDAQQLRTPDTSCVLVAPTWGKLSMLTRYGAAVPKILAEAGFHVIMRPHPQSYISDTKLMEDLEIELSGHANVTWDRNPDGFDSLQRASVMISDISGVVFDFAFLFSRPVITLYDACQDPAGFEAFDIPYPRWDSTVLDELGAGVTTPDLEHLPDLVRKLAAKNDWADRIGKVRDACIANFGCAARPVVDAILDIAARKDK